MPITRKAKTAIAAAFLLCAVSGAAAATNSGAYIGIGLGATAFNDGGMVEDFNRELGGDLLSLEDTASGFKVYGGYQFNAIAAVEAAFTDYGQFSVRENVFGTSASVTPTSLSLSANLGYDFADGQFRPFVLIGLAQVYDMNFNEFSDDDNTLGLHIGLGFQYDPKQLGGFGFRLAYEGDAFGVSTGASGTTYIREDYSQSVGMVYAGAHYRF